MNYSDEFIKWVPVLMGGSILLLVMVKLWVSSVSSNSNKTEESKS